MIVRIYLPVLVTFILLVQISWTYTQKKRKIEHFASLCTKGSTDKNYFSLRNSEQSRKKKDVLLQSISSTDLPQTTPSKTFRDFLRFLDRWNMARLRRAQDDEKTKLVVDLDKNEVNIKGKGPSKAVHVLRMVEEDGVVVEIPKSFLRSHLAYFIEGQNDFGIPSNTNELLRAPKHFRVPTNDCLLSKRIFVRNSLASQNSASLKTQFQITPRIGPYLYEVKHKLVNKVQKEKKFDKSFNHAKSKNYDQENVFMSNDNLKFQSPQLTDKHTRLTLGLPNGLSKLQENIFKIRDWIGHTQTFRNKKIKKSIGKASLESDILAKRKPSKIGKMYRIPLSSLCRVYAQRQKLASDNSTCQPSDDAYLDVDSDYTEESNEVSLSCNENKSLTKDFNSTCECNLDPYKFCSTLVPKCTTQNECSTELSQEATKTLKTTSLQVSEPSKESIDPKSTTTNLKLEDTSSFIMTKRTNGSNTPATEPTNQNLSSTLSTLPSTLSALVSTVTSITLNSTIIGSTQMDTATLSTTTLNKTTLNSTFTTPATSNSTSGNLTSLTLASGNLTTSNQTSGNLTTLNLTSANVTTPGISTTMNSTLTTIPMNASLGLTNISERVCSCPVTTAVCTTTKKRKIGKCSCARKCPTEAAIWNYEQITSTECEGLVVHPTVKVILKNAGPCVRLSNSCDQLAGLKYTLTVYKTTGKPNYSLKKVLKRRRLMGKNKIFFEDRTLPAMEKECTGNGILSDNIRNSEEVILNAVEMEESQTTTDLLEIANTLERRLKSIENKTLAVIARKKGKVLGTMNKPHHGRNRVDKPYYTPYRHFKHPELSPLSFIKSAKRDNIYKNILFSGLEYFPTKNFEMRKAFKQLNSTQADPPAVRDIKEKKALDNNMLLRRILSSDNRFERQNSNQNIFAESKPIGNTKFEGKDKKVFWATINPENGTNLVVFYVVNKNTTELPKEIDLKIQPYEALLGREEILNS